MAQKYLAGKIRLAFRQKLPGDTPAPAGINPSTYCSNSSAECWAAT